MVTGEEGSSRSAGVPNENGSVKSSVSRQSHSAKGRIEEATGKVCTGVAGRRPRKLMGCVDQESGKPSRAKSL